MFYGYPSCINGKLSLRLSGYAMFGATFNLVTRVGLPYFVGSMNDDSLPINTLASKTCICHINVSKMAQNFLKNG